MLTESQKNLADEVCRTTLFFAWTSKPKTHKQLIITLDPEGLLKYIHRSLAASLSKRRGATLEAFLQHHLSTATIEAWYPPVMDPPHDYQVFDLLGCYRHYHKIYVDRSTKETVL